MSQISSVADTGAVATRPRRVARRKSNRVRGTLPALVLFLPPALLLFPI